MCEARRRAADSLRMSVKRGEWLDVAVAKAISSACGGFNAKALGEFLAELVDHPTCQMVECAIDHGSRSWGMRCTECGKEFEHVKPGFGWRFCPNCGAMVVEEGGCDVREI